jgi:hypothetical protein
MAVEAEGDGFEGWQFATEALDLSRCFRLLVTV